MRQPINKFIVLSKSVYSSLDVLAWRKNWIRVQKISKIFVLNIWKISLIRLSTNTKLRVISNSIKISRATLLFTNFTFPFLRSFHNNSRSWGSSKNLINSSWFTLINKVKKYRYLWHRFSASIKISSATLPLKMKTWISSMRVNEMFFTSQDQNIFRCWKRCS